ncbi:MAG: acyltransferase [Terracidiphilus sp.]|jgi:peptidoglycan/LPS O-acetylase OafA/YrhL
MSENTAAKNGTRNPSLSYLRAFVTLLVVAHHSVLAYHPFAPPIPHDLTAQPAWWQAFPVVDPSRWEGFSFLVGSNDIFFMSLMFFLSGLFVWPSLKRRGAPAFLKHRLLRLGLPFAVSIAVLAPLAYYATYRLTGADPGLPGVCQDGDLTEELAWRAGMVPVAVAGLRLRGRSAVPCGTARRGIRGPILEQGR